MITQTVVSPAPATPAQTSGPVPSQNPASAPASSGGGGGASQNLYGLPPIHHVFLIVLSDQGFGQTFAPTSQDHYLSNTLVDQGELITNYYAVAGTRWRPDRASSAAGTNAADDAELPGVRAHHAGNSQVRRPGDWRRLRVSVHDEDARRRADGRARSWKAYVESIDTTPNGQQGSCRHPEPGAIDTEHASRVKDPYVTWINPFVYFTSLTSGTDCLDNDVGLTALLYDLRTGSQAPSVSFILPNGCHDGSDVPCSPTSARGTRASRRVPALDRN